MKDKKATISVVIPSYNRRHCIWDAINSVLAQGDKYFHSEIIVYDDGSTDGTAQLFKRKKDARIRYFRGSENKGVNYARNYGIRKAHGDYLMFLDSDDMLTKDSYRMLHECRDSLGALNFLGTIEKSTGKRMYALSSEGTLDYKDWLEGKRIAGEFLPLVHKQVFRHYMYDEDRFCFERFFWNKVVRKYGIVVIDKPIRLYSYESGNRVSRLLADPRYARKRAIDYERYIAEFGKDYLQFGLNKQYSELLLRLGLYQLLSGERTAARKSVRKARQYYAGMSACALLFLSHLPTSMFLRLYSYGIRFLKI